MFLRWTAESQRQLAVLRAGQEQAVRRHCAILCGPAQERDSGILRHQGLQLGLRLAEGEHAGSVIDEHAAEGSELVVERHVQHARSEEHTSELQSLMRISYAVFCLKKKKN